MIDLEGIYKNESVEDVLLHFAPKTSYPSIDRIYVRYNFEVVGNAELHRVWGRLMDEGKLAQDEKGRTIKGPNWKEPAFVTEKKYIFE